MGCAHSTEKAVVDGICGVKRTSSEFIPPKPSQLYPRADERKSGISSEEFASESGKQLSRSSCQQPCAEEAGPATVRQLQIVGSEPGTVGDAVLEVVCEAFQVESTCVAVTDSHEKVFFWAGRGICSTGSHSVWAQQFVTWVVSANNNEAVIVEDGLTDTRVKDSPMVCAEPGVRFFAGAPLVASNGTCIGALCVFDNKARGCDAVEVSVLAGMAEVAVRELESAWAAQHAHARGLLRPPAAFSAATMLVDASQRAWRVLHLNAAVSTMTGVSAHMAGASSFWALFSCREVAGDHPWAAFQEPVEAARPFTVRRAQRRGSSIHTAFQLTFTPVTSPMDKHAVPIGIPCAAALQPSTHRYFFVSVRPDTDADVPAGCSHGAPQPAAVPLPGLELGPLLAQSTYGRTYRGFHNGTPVAVKVVSNGRRNLRYRDGKPVCAALSEGLKSSSAPIVRTLAHACHYSRARPVALHKAPQGKKGGADCEVCFGDAEMCGCREEDGRSLCEMSDSACSLQDGDCNATATHETWLIQEYCGLGTLQGAIEKGKFHRSSGRVDAMSILAVADDVASGMTFLHGHHILHGNLSAASILLAVSQKASHGFKAKVSDWGMLRELDTHGFASPQKYPCLSHLAPEVLLKGTMSKAADVYSFGVLVWEMAAGQRLWASMGWSQAMAAATLKRARPRTPRHRCTPAALESLARLCMAFDPDNRPSFDEVKSIVRAMRTGQSSQNPAADMKLLQKVDLSCEEMRDNHLISLGLGGARVRGHTTPTTDGSRRGVTPPIITASSISSGGDPASDMLLDGERPCGPRKVSLRDARGAGDCAAPRPAGPKPRVSISASIEEAVRAKESTDIKGDSPPSDHRSAAAQLWHFPAGARSMDAAAHGEWSRVSLCQPPPHLKQIIDAARVNHAGQPPQHSQDSGANRPWAARRSVDVRRSMAGRGIRSGAAERVCGGSRRDVSPHDECGKPLAGLVSSPVPTSAFGSPTDSPPAGTGSPSMDGAAREKLAPGKKLNFNGSKRVSFDRGLDALRASLQDSPSGESFGCRGKALASSAAGAKPRDSADIHDLHSIGRTLPRVRVTLPK